MAGLKYPLVELFTELDRLHFGGRLTAAGWQVKAYFFNYRDEYDSALLGRCDPSAHFILIYPERKAPKEEALRQTMLHEMAHASNFEQYRHGATDRLGGPRYAVSFQANPAYAVNYRTDASARRGRRR
jgi:hypothetical protein